MAALPARPFRLDLYCSEGKIQLERHARNHQSLHGVLPRQRSFSQNAGGCPDPPTGLERRRAITAINLLEGHQVGGQWRGWFSNGRAMGVGGFLEKGSWHPRKKLY